MILPDNGMDDGDEAPGFPRALEIEIGAPDVRAGDPRPAFQPQMEHMVEGQRYCRQSV